MSTTGSSYNIARSKSSFKKVKFLTTYIQSDDSNSVFYKNNFTGANHITFEIPLETLEEQGTNKMTFKGGKWM